MKQIFFTILMGFVLILGLFVSYIFYKVTVVPRRTEQAVKSHLSYLKHIDSYTTNVDDNGLVNARVTLQNKKVISFSSLVPQSFVKYPYLFISMESTFVYPLWEAKRRARDEPRKYDLKRMKVLPFKLFNVQDVVDHYDDIVRIIQLPPDLSPEIQKSVGEDSTYFYYVSRQ